MRKVLYFAPAIFGLMFYSLLAAFSGFGAIHPAVWICISMLFVSAFLLAQKKWFGCIPGILVGILLICMSFQSTGQVIDIERPLGIALIVFYIFCGYGSDKRKEATACLIFSGSRGFPLPRDNQRVDEMFIKIFSIPLTKADYKCRL